MLKAMIAIITIYTIAVITNESFAVLSQFA